MPGIVTITLCTLPMPKTINSVGFIAMIISSIKDHGNKANDAITLY